MQPVGSSSPDQDRNGAPCVGSTVLTARPPGKKSSLLEILDVTAGLCPSAKPALRLGVHWVSGHWPCGTAAGVS